jgi:hypothetical protein
VSFCALLGEHRTHSYVWRYVFISNMNARERERASHSQINVCEFVWALDVCRVEFLDVCV